MARTLVCSVVFVCLACTGNAQSRSCTRDQSQRAETEAPQLRSWDALYESFRTYSQCDDGAVAEGYSESVAWILTNNWSSVQHFSQLATKNVKFQRFVLKHIDATLDAGALAKIADYTKAKCPQETGKLCSAINHQAESALKEVKSQ